MAKDTEQRQEAASELNKGTIRSQIDLDAALTRRRSGYVRLLFGGMLVALIVAIVVSQWHALSSRWQPVETPLAQATALIVSDISSGTVIFNGQRLVYHDGVVVSLRQGRNTFVFDAPPFRSRQCVLTWPLGGENDDCQGADQRSPFMPDHPAVQVNGKTAHVDYIIALPFTLSDIPDQLQQQAIDAVKQSLANEAAADQTTVLPGEHYAASIDAKGVTTAGIATEPLTATPVLTLDTTKGAVFGCADVICGNIGTSNQLIHLPAGGSLRWIVSVSEFLGWRFSAPNGKTIASVQLPGKGGPSLVLALVNSAQGWRVVPLSSDGSNPELDLHTQIMGDLCNASGTMVPALMPQLNDYSIGSYTNQGCRISGSGVTLIWRFGVLLAADEATHQQVQQIPLATPSERAAIAG